MNRTKHKHRHHKKQMSQVIKAMLTADKIENLLYSKRKSVSTCKLSKRRADVLKLQSKCIDDNLK